MSEQVDLKTLRPGVAVTINGKIFAKCDECKCLVRLDKFLFGDLHICRKR